MTGTSLASRIGADAEDNPPLLARRYEALELVAAGGEGELVRAWDHHLNRPVALKVRSAGEGVDRNRLLDEARALLNVRPHPNMAFVRDDFFEGDKHYLVLDWVAGEDLRTRLRREGRPGLPFDAVARAVTDVAAVLDHLHTHHPPVVHGDVKPANIVLAGPDDGGRAVLVDFGSASNDARLSGVTLEYAAPEVLAGEPPSPAADIFALAATTFELLTGRVAVPGATLDWSGVPPEQVPHVREALMAGLALNPTERTGSAAEFADRLTSGRGPGDPRGARTRWQRNRGRTMVAVALVAGLLVGGVTVLLTRSDRPAATRALSEAQILSGSLPAGVKEIGRLGIYQTWGYFNTYTIGADGSAALEYHQENMAHGWPTIEPVNADQLLFYRPGADGGGAVVQWHRYGTLLDLYDVPKLGTGWTNVTMVRPGVLYMYNKQTGAEQLATFRANSETPVVTKLSTTAPNLTELSRVSDTQVVQYDDRTGRAQVTTLRDGGSATVTALTGLAAGLEDVQGVGDGRIAYGDAAEGKLHVAAVDGDQLRDRFTVDLHGAAWDRAITVAVGRLLLYSTSGNSELVTVGDRKATVGPRLSLLSAAAVLVAQA